jgi:hypothetical protein
VTRLGSRASPLFLSRSSWQLIVLIVLAFVPPGLVWVVGEVKGMSPGFLTRDPAALTGSPWYLGALSTFGLFLWASAATSAILGFFSARGRAQFEARLFLWAGAISVVLGLDDAFQIHEEIAPEDLGIPQRVVYVFYIVMIVIFVWHVHRSISHMGRKIPIAAGLFFAISFVVDAIESIENSLLEHSTVFYVEDGAKFIGIALWAAFLLRAAVRESSPGVPSIDSG